VELLTEDGIQKCGVSRYLVEGIEPLVRILREDGERRVLERQKDCHQRWYQYETSCLIYDHV